jgi:hypothetical protein
METPAANPLDPASSRVPRISKRGETSAWSIATFAAFRSLPFARCGVRPIWVLPRPDSRW